MACSLTAGWECISTAASGEGAVDAAAAALCATYNTSADPNEEADEDELALLKMVQFVALTLLVVAVVVTYETRPPLNTFSLAIVGVAYIAKLLLDLLEL